jgi:ABC-2 type transport system ATP-binding protein
MSENTALYVKGLSKDFSLPHERKNSLKEKLLHPGKSTYEKFHALSDIDFEVKKGEFFGIVGRNGSGKSTLLKIIGGIYQPTKGSVEVNGTLTPFIELGIGFNPELTGRENVYLNGAILGLTHKETQNKYQEIVDFAELERFMDQKLKNYSSGMQVRLAFSIAIQAHNDILLIDEVLAVGDERFQRKSIEVFEKIKKDKTKTVIFVSHDMQAIQQFCDRVLVIHDSGMQYIGDSARAAMEYKKLNFPDLVQEANTDVKSLARKDQRAGSGKIRVLKFNIKDFDGKPDQIISFGQPFTIDFQYEAKEDLKDVVFGVGIKNKKGDSVYGPNTKESRMPLDIKKGKGSITLSVANNVIAPGSYALDAGFFDDSQTVCHDYISVRNALTFVGIERHGYVYVEPKWTIK